MKSIIFILSLLIFFSGCDKYQTYESEDGKPVLTSDGIYFKQFYVNNSRVTIQCDKDGNIVNSNVSSSYQSGKTTVHNQSIAIGNNNSNSNTIVFECSKIEDCESQISIFKSHIK